MDYLLSEEEYKRMIPRSTHDEECQTYQKRIKTLKAIEKQLKSECNAEYSKECFKTEKFGSILDIMLKSAKSIILSVAKKQGGSISDVPYTADYYDKEGMLKDASIESIDNNGKITLQDEEENTHLDKLLSDTILGILDVLPDEDMENTEVNNQ